MVDKKRLDMVHAGDPYIRAETLNGAIRVANQWDATGLDWDTVEHYFDDGITRQVSNVSQGSSTPTPTDPDYEFKTIRDSMTTVSVQWGMWVRNGYPANTVGEITTTTVLNVVPDGTDQYVVATLASDTDHDPALIPDTELTLSIAAAEPEDDQYDKQMVIARINTTGDIISDVFQIRRGGRKEDAVVRCDGDTYSIAAPLRRTLEMNPFEETHKDELQLYNVDTCFKNSLSFPYFDSDAPEIIAGTLKWACPDSHLENNVEESIQISTNAAGYSIVQIYGFRTASTIDVPSIEGGDLVMFKNISSSSVGYMSFSNLLEYVEDGFDMSTICAYIKANCNLCEWIDDHCDVGSWGIQNHYNLVDIEPGDYCRHDHKNYWQNVQSQGGRCGAPSTNFSVNNGSSIGNSSTQLTIDLDNNRLHTSGSIMTVDWGLRQLYDYNIGQYTVVNWAAQYLANDIGQVVLDWANQALEDDGEECLTWDDTSVDITATPLFKVLNTTAVTGTSGVGALLVSGGGYFAGGVNIDGTSFLTVPDNPGHGLVVDHGTRITIIGTDSTAILCEATGATVRLAYETGPYAVHAETGGINANATSGFLCNGTKVAGARGAAVANATGAEDVVAQLNELLKRVRAHGLIAT